MYLTLLNDLFERVNEVRHGSRFQNRQVIVAQYIGTGNLMGQLTQGNTIIYLPTDNNSNN